ncbi:pyridoxamine 5'-phosphate oxidase family protein [Amycolatopsis halotolerans]|uniref:Pyridoxamine 5'-phosphate oxidase family protein n=1 Tax=Amycolatopsis halotolerans TaxID=330083 RepID=A0ABV7QJJ6_9PSEU
MSTLTDHDLEFLRRPLHGFLTVAAGPRPPQPRPVWFEATDEGTIQLFTAPDSAKIRQLSEDPRASIVVAAPVGEPERWVSVAGRVTIEADGGHDLARRLAERYWDLSTPEGQAGAKILQDLPQVRVVIHPEKVHRYAF